MKNFKRKLLVLLLSAVCVTAGAVGLSACNTGGEGNDSTLYALYLADTENGTTKTYNEWLKDKLTAADVKDGETPYIGENGNWWVGETDLGVSATGPKGDKGDPGNPGKGIASVTMLDGNFIVIYTDGTFEIVKEAENSPIKLLKAKAVDQNGEPVAGAYLKLYYYDTVTYTSKDVDVCKTDQDGIAKFMYAPLEGKNYVVRLADIDEIDSDHNTPENYEIADTTFAVPESTASTQTMEVAFKNVAGSFSNAVTHGKVINVPYTRKYVEETSSVVETNGTTNGAFTVNVKTGFYTYICFLPYVSPSATDNTEENDRLIANATQAAAGKYTVTVSGGNGAKISYFVGSLGYMVTDEYGIPYPATAETKGVDALTETSVSLNNDTKSVRGDCIFGISAQADCTVTVTVERTGDAVEIPDPVLITVNPPSNLEKYPNATAGQTLTLMPVTGAFIAVYGDDGYWHVNSKDGPRLLVQLKKSVARFMELSLEKYPEGTDLKQGVLYFNGDAGTEGDFDENGNPLKKYDYNAVLKAYCEKVNADGVYGVDDKMYTMLNKLAEMGVGLDNQSTAAEYRWLLACYYYAPAGGLDARGSGTEQDPYIIAVGSNSIPSSGVMSFTAGSKGVYKFDSTANPAYTFPQGVRTYSQTEVINNITHYVTYALIDEVGEYKIILNSSAKVSVVIDQTESLAPVSGDDATGVSVQTAAGIMKSSGILGIVYDTAVLNDGVYISFTCMLGDSGKYKLTLLGEGSTIEVVGGTGTPSSSVTVDVVHDIDIANNDVIRTEVVIKITAPSSTHLMLVIEEAQ